MEKRIRSVAKTISWRFIATLITLLLAYLWLHEWTTSIALAILINGIKALAYYLHERGWNLIHWGRVEASSFKKGFTVWFTGLPSSGKSTLADAVAEKLKAKGMKVERLDGDIIRRHLWKELGFSKEDRDENIRRVTYLASMLTRNGVAVLTSFVSPYREIREEARGKIGKFVEVYVKCPLEVCIQRDTRGMYKRALAGEIEDFTGISHPYEEPLNAEVVVETDKETIGESVNKILERLKELGYA
jgi:adenylylsulfate kinase